MNYILPCPYEIQDCSPNGYAEKSYPKDLINEGYVDYNFVDDLYYERYAGSCAKYIFDYGDAWN